MTAMPRRDRLARTSRAAELSRGILEPAPAVVYRQTHGNDEPIAGRLSTWMKIIS